MPPASDSRNPGTRRLGLPRPLLLVLPAVLLAAISLGEGNSPTAASGSSKTPSAASAGDDDEISDASAAILTAAVKKQPEKQKQLVTELVKDMTAKTASVEKLDGDVKKLESAPHDDPASAARLADARLKAEDERQTLRQERSVANWIIEKNPFKAPDANPGAAPPSFARRDCGDIEDCRKLKAIGQGEVYRWDNMNCPPGHPCETLGADFPPPQAPPASPRDASPTPSTPVPAAHPAQPPAPTPSASAPSTNGARASEPAAVWQQWLDQQTPETKNRLAQQYRDMADHKKHQESELAAALEGADKARQGGDAAAERWAQDRSQRLEGQRDAGLQAFRENRTGAVSSRADAVATPAMTPTAGAGDVLQHTLEAQRSAEAVNGAIEGIHDELVAAGAIPPSPSVLSGVSRGPASDEKVGAAAAGMMFGTHAAGPAATLLLAASDVVRGGGDALQATRELQRLRLMIEGTQDPDTRRSILALEEEALRSTINVYASAGSEFRDIAGKLAQGKVPGFMPLPLEVQEALYPLARQIGPGDPALYPTMVRDSQPGGIKFTPSNLDPSMFQLDLEGLYFDRGEQNLVLAGRRDGKAALIDADVLAAALLLAAQGGDPPWFSLDPIDPKAWDGVVHWVPEHLQSLGSEKLARRFQELLREHKAIRRRGKDGTYELFATLDAVDPALYDQLRAESEIGVHLAFSHEFLRFTEAGRILFDADKALKQAVQGATVVGDAVRDAALGAPLTDKTDSTAGRGDFTPQVVGALGPDGVAGVKDLTLRLELTARVENTNIDDTDKKIEAFSDAMTKFNDNVDGVRDKILESSYAIGRLRQFFKAYFSAKALMDRDPAMRALVLASVRPPLREALPQRYLEPPIVVLTVCPEFLEGRPCTGEKGLGLGATCGFGGGISFGGPGRGLAGFRDAPADPALTSLALIGRQVARSDGPGVVTRDGRSFLRVALSAAPHAREVGEIDLEHPWRGGDRYAGRPGGLPARALLLACALAGMFAAWSLGAASSAEEEPSRGAGTLLALTALSAAALPAAALLRGGLWGTEWLAFGAFAAASAATLAAQRRRSRWSQPVAVAFHLSVLAASVFILEDALGAGGSLLRGETFAAASSAAALVWIGASGLRLMTERWRTLCGRCRTWEGASLSAGFLSAAVVLASALFLSISAVLLPPMGRTATHLGRSALAMAIGAVLAVAAALVTRAAAKLRALVARARGRTSVSPPTLERCSTDMAASCLAAAAWPMLGMVRTVIPADGAAVTLAARAAALGAVLYLLNGAWRNRLARQVHTEEGAHDGE